MIIISMAANLAYDKYHILSFRHFVALFHTKYQVPKYGRTYCQKQV